MTDHMVARGPGTVVDDAAPGFNHRIDRLFIDVARAIQDGLLEPAEFADVDRVLSRLEAARRGDGRASAARLGSTVEIVRDLISTHQPTDPGHRVRATFEPISSALGFRRSLFSTVDNARWVPTTLYIEAGLPVNHAPLRQFLTAQTISLQDAPLEAEAVQRLKPRLVESPKTHIMTYKPLMTASDSHGYAVAPVLSKGTVVGMIHADRFDRPALRADLDRVAFSSSVMGLLAEQIVQRRRLSELAERLSSVVEFAEEVLAGRARFDAVANAGHRIDRASPSREPMTARQRSILRRLSTGATNAQIAREVGIAEGTVKAHIKQIYARLGVHSRAAAAAAYRAGLDNPALP
ncbi:MAG TPA: LuxR C-terminal-related transcriptional regulator [Aldersonia sp.]